MEEVKKNPAPECVRCEKLLECKKLKEHKTDGCEDFEERVTNMITGKKRLWRKNT